jgi:hypothetical protein
VFQELHILPPSSNDLFAGPSEKFAMRHALSLAPLLARRFACDMLVRVVGVAKVIEAVVEACILMGHASVAEGRAVASSASYRGRAD